MQSREVVPADRVRPRLFDAYPQLASSVPWRPLAHVPTAVEQSPVLREWTGRDDVWMKRDDRISPLYGGNKVRRYEHVLADAEARGAKRIVTVGGVASTQVMATALFGAALGFDVHAVLYDQPLTTFAREAVLTDVTAGATLEWGGSYVMTAIRAVGALRHPKGAYVILPGAAAALANLGYVDAMLELDAQVRAGEMPRPAAIVLPTGSSGTLAALAIGAALLGWDTEVIGVRIAPWITTNRFTIGAIVRDTVGFLARRVDALRTERLAQRAHFSLVHGAIGPGYGHATPEAIAAMPTVDRLLGTPGEVTYSAKALVGLRTVAAMPRFVGRPLLLWNTLSSVRPPIAGDARARVPASLERVFAGDVAV